MKKTELSAEELMQVTGGSGFAPIDEIILVGARKTVPGYANNDEKDEIILQDASPTGVSAVVTNPKGTDRNFILG